jgi:hypothetical protein
LWHTQKSKLLKNWAYLKKPWTCKLFPVIYPAIELEAGFFLTIMTFLPSGINAAGLLSGKCRKRPPPQDSIYGKPYGDKMKIPPDVLAILESELNGLDHGTATLTVHIRDGRPRFVIGRERSFLPETLVKGVGSSCDIKNYDHPTLKNDKRGEK